MNVQKEYLNKKVLMTFYKKKVTTIKELKELMQCSVRTIYTRLRAWKAISSYNMNSRYYTLADIAKFDSNGLWHYKGVYFSRHGNLKQTLVYLVNNSEQGLTAKSIGRLLGLDTRSFLFNCKDMPGLHREKIKGRYVYFSSDKLRYGKQFNVRAIETEKQQLISPLKDSVGIAVLVEQIKNIKLDTQEISKILSKQGIMAKADSITDFYKYHGIEKKTLDLYRLRF